MTKKLFLVETVSLFRMRYVVEANEESHALDEVVCNTTGDVSDNWGEFSQCHLDEVISSSREITQEEYFKLHAIDNAYMSSWSDEEKLKLINKIDYTK